MKLVIDIPEDYYKAIKEIPVEQSTADMMIIQNGTPLPQHGKLVDISKIDDDRIDSDNPVIYLTINGEYTEAVSLEYLNSLPTIIEADKEGDVE